MPPAAVTLFVPWLRRLTVILELESLNTTELGPDDVVTPVPPYATPIVEPFQVPELIVPNAVTLPLAFKLTDFSAG